MASAGRSRVEKRRDQCFDAAVRWIELINRWREAGPSSSRTADHGARNFL